MSEPEVPCIRVLQVGSGGIESVSWSPDGTRLAIASRIVEVLTAEGRSLWRSGERRFAEDHVAWSPDGRRLASLSSLMDTVQIWDAESGQLRSLDASGSLGYSLDWSPEGKRLAWTPNEEVVLADADTGELQRSYTGHETSTYSVAWSPDGSRLASGDSRGKIHIWNARSGALISILQQDPDEIRCLRWSPDGKRLACCGHDVRIWDVAGPRCLASFESGRIREVSWSPSSALLAVGVPDDATVLLLESENGREVNCLRGHSSGVQSVAFSPDGTRLASAGNDLRIWDVSRLPASRAGSAIDDSISIFAARQAATVGRRSVVQRRALWVPQLPGAKGMCLGVLHGTGAKVQGGHEPSADVSRDGRALATGHPDGLVRLWDLERGQPLWVGAPTYGARVQDVKFSPRGDLLASASESPVRIWRSATGECILSLETRLQCLHVAWSPDGNRLATAFDNGLVQVWNLWTSEARRFEGHTLCVRAVSWSPDDVHLASAAIDNTVRVWDLRTGRTIETLHFPSWAKDVKWSPDGRWLATCSGAATATICSAPNWEPRLVYRNHLKSEYGLRCLAWSPDGRLVASAGGDKVVHVWEAEGGREVARFQLLETDVWRLAWSPTGSFLVSSHAGDVFRFWDTRSLVAEPRDPFVALPATGPLPRELSCLPQALASLHRIGLHPPLSLVKDLLALTGGAKVDGPLATLAGDTGLRSLAALRWPEAARVGLTALLLHGAPLADWSPPAGASPGATAEALRRALRGEPAEPAASPPPLAALQQASEQIDDRLLTLLATLGPDAVAADPGLPLRLLPKLPAMPALTAARRQLLGLRLRQGTPGRSLGHGAGSERSGVERRGDLRSLLPSQLALPDQLLASRYLRGELLYRAHTGEESPRLRPAVLVLDVSPPSFGPVEATTRLAAHVLASSLLQAGLPVVLVTAGGAVAVYALERIADLVAVWTSRSLEPAQAGQVLRTAQSLRHTLRDGPLEPVIVLLTHTYFGAEEDLPAVAGLRGLFVQYPRQHATPSLAAACERWETVAAGATDELSQRLARVAG